MLRQVLFGVLAAGLAACGGDRPGETGTQGPSGPGGIAGGQARRGGPPPNVFLILIDTLRADRLGCYGWERNTSPRIDRLASEGALFAGVTAQSSWTRTSVASLMTGRYFTTYRDEYEDDAKTLAESFKEQGYRTLGVIGNILINSERGFDRGFDHFDLTKDKERRAKFNEPGRDAIGIFKDLMPELERALADGEAPVFCYVHLMDPHHPYLAHPHEDLEEKPSVEKYLGWHHETYAASGIEVLEKDRDWPWELMAWSEGRYEEEVRFTDDILGQFLDTCTERGWLDDAVVALVSDHGEGLYDHVSPQPRLDRPGIHTPQKYFFMDHGNFMYEELLHTPFILWGSRVPERGAIDVDVQNIDLFPTLMDLCGLEKPDTLHGKSLVPLLDGSDQEPHEYVHSFTFQTKSVREVASGWKLVLPTEKYVDSYERQLFFLPDDPRERDNRFSAEPEVVARLRQVMTEWRERHPTPEQRTRKRSEEENADLQDLGYLGDMEEEEDG